MTWEKGKMFRDLIPGVGEGRGNGERGKSDNTFLSFKCSNKRR